MPEPEHEVTDVAGQHKSRVRNDGFDFQRVGSWGPYKRRQSICRNRRRRGLHLYVSACPEGLAISCFRRQRPCRSAAGSVVGFRSI